MRESFGYKYCSIDLDKEGTLERLKKYSVEKIKEIFNGINFFYYILI